MRTVLAGLVFSLLAALPVSAQNAGNPTIHKIALTKDIPTATLDVKVGDEIHFVRPALWIAPIPEYKVVATDSKKDTLLESLTPNNPQGAQELTFKVYRVERVGRGFIRLSTTPVVPYPKVTEHQYLKINAR